MISALFKTLLHFPGKLLYAALSNAHWDRADVTSETHKMNEVFIFFLKTNLERLCAKRYREHVLKSVKASRGVWCLHLLSFFVCVWFFLWLFFSVSPGTLFSYHFHSGRFHKMWFCIEFF